MERPARHLRLRLAIGSVAAALSGRSFMNFTTEAASNMRCPLTPTDFI
jgi:hypothetical protein